MDPTRLMTMPATITPRTPADDPDEYNDEVLEAGDPFELTGGRGAGVLLQPRDTSEDTVANTERESFVLYAPVDVIVDDTTLPVPLDARALITIDGADYELDGEPQKWWNPRERSYRYQQANVSRVT